MPKLSDFSIHQYGRGNKNRHPSPDYFFDAFEWLRVDSSAKELLKKIPVALAPARGQQTTKQTNRQDFFFALGFIYSRWRDAVRWDAGDSGAERARNLIH